MKTLITNISSLVTVDANRQLYKSGSQMQDVGEIKNGAIYFNEKILWIGKAHEAIQLINNRQIDPDQIIDANGKTVMPGFVDSHTHIVFAGNRSQEFARRLRGVSYQQIASEGGGILTTMKGTREASLEDLVETARKIAKNAIKHGTTALEIKSGYGLTVESEIKILKAIQMLKDILPLHISATFLGAHDFPPEYKNNRQDYIKLIIDQMIPKIANENLAEFCDAFIDKGYYTLEEGKQVLQTALKYGLKLKVHCDELADVGAAELAAQLGAISADHLLFVNEKGINALKNSKTCATLLPGTAYFIRMPYAPARKLIENDNIVALSTDCNPGSSFTENMQLILSLAAINMNMTAEEAICAATINGAYAIAQSKYMGSLQIGKLANLILLDIDSYIDLFYHFGINHVKNVWIKGKQII